MSDLNDKEYFVRIFSFMSSKIDSFDDDGMAYALTNLAMKASENVCVARAAETHSNSLEALGIVMRETGLSIAPDLEPQWMPENYAVNLMGNLEVAIIGSDDEGALTGKDILNTLKEGKDGS